MRPSNNLENKTLLDTYYIDRRVQLVCVKVQTHNSLEPPLEYQDNESRFVMTLLIILGVTEILCSFRLVLAGKTGKEIPEIPEIEFLEKFSANNFALSVAENNASVPLNRYSSFFFSRKLLVICQKFREPSFCEVIDSCFISIWRFGSFKNPFAIITNLFKLSFRS